MDLGADVGENGGSVASIINLLGILIKCALLLIAGCLFTCGVAKALYWIADRWL